MSPESLILSIVGGIHRSENFFSSYLRNGIVFSSSSFIPTSCSGTKCPITGVNELLYAKVVIEDFEAAFGNGFENEENATRKFL